MSNKAIPQVRVEQKLISLISFELQIKININSSNTPHLSTTWPSERTCLGLSDHPTQQRPLLCTSTPPPMSFDCIDAELRPPLTKTSLGVSTFPDHFCQRNHTWTRHGQRGSGELFGIGSLSQRLHEANKPSKYIIGAYEVLITVVWPLT